jgi:pimeloyl-ACP methyl ester carboxylesterase
MKASIHTKWANAYEVGQPSGWGLASIVLFDSEAGVRDLRNYFRGIVTSQNHFRDAVEHKDLRSLGNRFDLPFFVFQGAEDNVTPVEPVREYFESIAAPRKAMILIPSGGHNVATTRSADFLALLDRYVRPFALAQ